MFTSEHTQFFVRRFYPGEVVEYSFHCTHNVVFAGGFGKDRMESNEFARIRVYLEKTQRELAQLLGISVKAVQSFEQGWRNIPVHIERQILFILTMKEGGGQSSEAVLAAHEVLHGSKTAMPCV